MVTLLSANGQPAAVSLAEPPAGVATAAPPDLARAMIFENFDGFNDFDLD